MSNLEKEFPPTLSTFVPRQVAESKRKTTSSLSQDGPLQVARAAIAYLPSLTTESQLHDNGCGDGNVSRSILSSLPESAWPARIDATDIAFAQAALDRLHADSSAKKWPVHTRIASAQDLSIFPDESFTASIANCVIYRFPDSDAKRAAHEMYRTLKSGGTAIATGFGCVPHRAALAAAHEATRPAGTGPLIGGAVRWEDGKLLESVMRDAGFRQVDMHETKTTTIVENLAEWEFGMWAIVGRPASGWLESDEQAWDEALHIFDATIRRQPGFSILESEDGKPERAQFTSQAWIAVARK